MEEEGEPSEQAQRLAVWAVCIIAVLIAAALALWPGAWQGTTDGLKFLTGYDQIERVVDEVSE